MRLQQRCAQCGRLAEEQIDETVLRPPETHAVEPRRIDERLRIVAPGMGHVDHEGRWLAEGREDLECGIEQGLHQRDRTIGPRSSFSLAAAATLRIAATTSGETTQGFTGSLPGAALNLMYKFAIASGI